jgi:hypothetical protein
VAVAARSGMCPWRATSKRFTACSTRPPRLRSPERAWWLR